MKKIIFIYFIILLVASGKIIDNAHLFQEQDKNILTNRVTQLNDIYNIDFIIISNTEEDFTIEDLLRDKEKKIIISILKKKQGLANVRIMLSSDLDFSNYFKEIERVLDNLETLILNKEYGNYTFELLANLGDIINLIRMEKEDLKEKSTFNFTKFFVSTFKILLSLVLLIFIYYLYRFYLKKKNLTKCTSCGKNMLIDQEIEKEENIMKIYKCTSCGKIKRINKKRY